LDSLNDTELGRMWKEPVVAHADVASQHFTGVTEKSFEKPIKIISVAAQNRTGYFPNTSLELHCRNQWLDSVNTAINLLVL
jgi:hypothetical protein